MQTIDSKRDCSRVDATAVDSCSPQQPATAADRAGSVEKARSQRKAAPKARKAGKAPTAAASAPTAAQQLPASAQPATAAEQLPAGKGKALQETAPSERAGRFASLHPDLRDAGQHAPVSNWQRSAAYSTIDPTLPYEERSRLARGRLDAYGIDNVCDDITAGKGTLAIAQQLGISVGLLYKWLQADHSREQAVTAARQLAAHVWDEQAEVELKGSQSMVAVARARELAAHYRWRARAFLPRVYGDQPPQQLAPVVIQLGIGAAKPAVDITPAPVQLPASASHAARNALQISGLRDSAADSQSDALPVADS